MENEAVNTDEERRRILRSQYREAINNSFHGRLKVAENIWGIICDNPEAKLLCIGSAIFSPKSIKFIEIGRRLDGSVKGWFYPITVQYLDDEEFEFVYHLQLNPGEADTTPELSDDTEQELLAQ